MNRHQRRAAEAHTRDDFERYAADYRNLRKRATDQEIGEAYMRGQAWEADNVAVTLSRTGEPVPTDEQCDVELAISYGTQMYAAYATSAYIKEIERLWAPFLAKARARTPPDKWLGEELYTQAFIVDKFVRSQHLMANFTTLIACALLWLAGPTDRKRIHCKITDPETIDSNNPLDFRWVFEMTFP